MLLAAAPSEIVVLQIGTLIVDIARLRRRIFAFDYPAPQNGLDIAPITFISLNGDFHRFWHDDKWLKEKTDGNKFDFNDVDALELFTGHKLLYV